MKINDVATKLIYIPQDLKKIGNISFYDLLKRTGYFELHKRVNENIICRALEVNIECISEWITYSEDKRCSSGWYIKKESNDNYLVGYYPHNDKKHTNKIFSNRIEACASFIKHEIEEIRL